MNMPLLSTKFRIHPVRRNGVVRHELLDRLDRGLDCRLILLSAPAGFGKSTLVGDWVSRLSSTPEGRNLQTRIAWLSLEEGENDYIRFLDYFLGAFTTTFPESGSKTGLGRIKVDPVRTPEPRPEQVLVPIINEITEVPARFVFVLDDYQSIESDAVHDAVCFLIDHVPHNMNLVVLTRHDPPLALSKLRSRGELCEVRAADLRFSLPEVAEFMKQTMGLELSAEEIEKLEKRTEGWAAGLQLAGLSLQGRGDTVETIESFAGSNRHVTDYLLEEVLHRQPEALQRFLLLTSVLERLSGPLCDAVTGGDGGAEALEDLERTNSFIVPLDEQRQWYRYHDLFRELLEGQLQLASKGVQGGEAIDIESLHLRASMWFEANGMELQAFHHAAATNDIARAERLLHGGGMPLHFRGGAPAVLGWMGGLPRSVLDSRPALWVTYASASIFVGQSARVEEKLEAAEAALRNSPSDDSTDDTKGRIAAIRAMLAVPKSDVDTIVEESNRALRFLHPDNVPIRTASKWTLGVAYHYKGDRAAAAAAFSDVVANSRTSGNTFFAIAASTQLGRIQETNNRLHLAEETYKRVLRMIGDSILTFACEAHLGLARIYYEWNELEMARGHGRECLQIARWIDGVDTPAACWVFSAQLRLAEGDVVGASAILSEAEAFVNRHEYRHRMAEVAIAQVRTLLLQGELETAARVSRDKEIPLGQARVHLALEDADAALVVLESLYQRACEKGWEDLRLRALVLEVLSFDLANRRTKAMRALEEALRLSAPEGFVRMFIDEGPQMTLLLREASHQGVMTDYVGRLLRELPENEGACEGAASQHRGAPELFEALSAREIEVLALIAEGLSNEEVGERLFISLHTIKAHTRNIYAKLEAHNRTEAVARARSLGILDQG